MVCLANNHGSNLGQGNRNFKIIMFNLYMTNILHVINTSYKFTLSVYFYFFHRQLYLYLSNVISVISHNIYQLCIVAYLCYRYYMRCLAIERSH